MNKLKNFSFKKLLSNRKFAVVFSIILAFVFWLLIATAQTPTIDRSLTNLAVNINTNGTVAGKLGLDEISGVSTTVTIKISGPAYVVGNVSEKDFVVSPSFANVTAPGSYTIPLNVTKLNNATECSVVSIIPSQLDLTFDYIDTKQFDVLPSVKGVSAVSGLVAENPIVSNSEDGKITIKAPRNYMDRIATVAALVEEKEVLSETKTYDGIITLFDKNGSELDISKYNVSANTVKISVPISKRKTVAVKPDFINAPALYGEFLKYNLSVSSVNIIGPAATVDSINEIKLSPIDFCSISKSQSSFAETPVLPDGVKIIDNVEKINLSIDTSYFTEKVFTVQNVNPEKNEKNYQVSLTTPIKNVKICGPKDVLRNIKADSLYASVDLSGKQPGDYTADVKIYCYNSKKIWQVGTYQASITVK